MRKPLLVLLALACLGAAPSRTQTYTAGQVINPSHVQENEDNIYTYLSAGVDTIRANAVVTGHILDGTILNADISSSAAIAYSKLSLTGSVVNADVAGSAAIAYSKLNLSDSVTASDLAATLTFADGDFLNLASINTSGTSEGLKLPQNTSCASGTAEGQICWDTDGDFLTVGTGAAALAINPLASTLVTYSRTAAAGTGDQAVTGAGFTPTTVLVQCVDATSGTRGSFGFADDAVGEQMIYNSAGTLADDPQLSLVANGGDTMTAVMKTLDSDGFTVTWTKGGSGLTAECVALALR